MRAGLLRGLVAACAIASLAACGSSPDAQWSVPLPLGDAYATTHVLSVSEAGPGVVVPIGNVVYGYDTAAEELAWSVTLDSAVAACEPAGVSVLCITETQSRVAIDADGNTAEVTGMGIEYSSGDSLYVTQAYEDRVELLAADPAKPLTPGEGEPIATYDGRTATLPDGTPIERDAQGNYPDPIAALVAGGVLLGDSPWLNPPAIARLSQPLADGFVMVDAGALDVSGAEPTTLTFFDLAGTETAKVEVAPSLHLSVNPDWTQREMMTIADEAAMLETDHAAIFQSGEVIGFNRILTSSVAPAYANVEGLEMADGTRLAFDPVAPETQGLWVVEHPYISVFGVGPDGSVGATFSATTGEQLIDAKCQWIGGETYCFTADRLAKISQL